MATFDIFPGRVHELEEDFFFKKKKHRKKKEPEDDQDEETEQSVSDSLHIRRQIARIRENMGIHQTAHWYAYYALAQIRSGSRQKQLWCV